jgi:colanic acid biosynthesis glycosyl transferase WcaI
LRQIEELAFVIAGESKALKNLQKYCLDRGADNVLLLPLQPREQLPQMLAAANVGLIVQKRNVISFNMPSKIPLLLASGHPIVGSVPATGTAAKAIRQSGGGIVVEPESAEALATAVLELYKNPALAAQLGKQGRKFASENYSFEQALERYEQLFFDAIAKKAATLDMLPELTSTVE